MGRQTGCIYKNKNGDRWLARWREDVIENGQLKRKLKFRDLAPVNDTYRREKDVQPLLDEILAPVNAGKVKPESSLSVSEYGEDHWLPWTRENCKPSTVAGYEFYWNTYLEPRLQKVAIRDFRTVDAANLLAELQRSNNLGRTMLKKAKAILSGIFTLARNQGVLDAANPIPGTMIPKKATAAPEMHAATPEEVVAILDAIDNAKPKDKEIERLTRLQAKAAVALQFFAGLRPGEARGACWEDYSGKRLSVRQSVWHTYTTTPKTEESAKFVPVIESLASILADLREGEGNPTEGPILRGPSKKPLNLDNLARRVLSPLLKAKELEWHGWYSFRRGVATTLAGITKDRGLASKGLLRHTSLATTQNHYIKDVPENTLQAMNLLEQLFNDCSTVKN
jgi:integrase